MATMDRTKTAERKAGNGRRRIRRAERFHQTARSTDCIVIRNVVDTTMSVT